MQSILSVNATIMRGGTSKGVFIKKTDLPQTLQDCSKKLDQFILRLIGSPDVYAKHIDGLGGASSSTSKVVLIGKSLREGFDIDYTFAQVSIDKSQVDWSGNCGNLTAAVGVFALQQGILKKTSQQKQVVKIWQTNIQKALHVSVPMCDGEVQELGEFYLDGVAFPSAQIDVDFIEPVAGELFPTGEVKQTLTVPEVGAIEVSLLNGAIPSIFMSASAIGLRGDELQEEINTRADVLEKVEKIRAYCAVVMGLIDNVAQAQQQQHTPKIILLSTPSEYVCSSGKRIKKEDIQLNVRAFSMGLLHHAMMGTAAVTLAAAANIPGTLVHDMRINLNNAPFEFGHPSGTMQVNAHCRKDTAQKWQVEKVSLARSARRMMQGKVFVPIL